MLSQYPPPPCPCPTSSPIRVIRSDCLPKQLWVIASNGVNLLMVVYFRTHGRLTNAIVKQRFCQRRDPPASFEYVDPKIPIPIGPNIGFRIPSTCFVERGPSNQRTVRHCVRPFLNGEGRLPYRL